MAKLRCIPSVNAFSGIAATESGVAAPKATEWKVADEKSPNGDILNLDLLKTQTAQDGYQIDYYEAAIEERGGETRIARVLYGPSIGKTRRLYCMTPLTQQRVRLRSVQRLKNQFDWNGNYTPEPGDPVSQPSTGATATVVDVSKGFVILDNISGTFESKQTVELKPHRCT